MKKVKYISSDLDSGVYENVIELTYNKITKQYTIFGFSQEATDTITKDFIKNWFDNQGDMNDFFGE
jgi:hypothetical protein